MCVPKKTSPETDLVSTAEAGHLLGKSVRTVHRLIRSGDLVPAMKIGGASGPYLFNRADVEALRKAS